VRTQILINYTPFRFIAVGHVSDEDLVQCFQSCGHGIHSHWHWHRDRRESEHEQTAYLRLGTHQSRILIKKMNMTPCGYARCLKYAEVSLSRQYLPLLPRPFYGFTFHKTVYITLPYQFVTAFARPQHIRNLTPVQNTYQVILFRNARNYPIRPDVVEQNRRFLAQTIMLLSKA
jgi:hypothetical protein